MPRTPATAVVDPGDIPVRQSRVPAASAKAPATTAARSVFDQVSPRPQALPEIVIRKGVPLPHPRTADRGGQLAATAKRMEVGDSVELPLWAAKSLMRVARKVGDACTPPPSLHLPQAEPGARRRVA